MDVLEEIEKEDFYELATAVSKRIKLVKKALGPYPFTHALQVNDNVKLEWIMYKDKFNLMYTNKEKGLYLPFEDCKGVDRMDVGLQALDTFCEGFLEIIKDKKPTVNYNR